MDLIYFVYKLFGGSDVLGSEFNVGEVAVIYHFDVGG